MLQSLMCLWWKILIANLQRFSTCSFIGGWLSVHLALKYFDTFFLLPSFYFRFPAKPDHLLYVVYRSLDYRLFHYRVAIDTFFRHFFVNFYEFQMCFKYFATSLALILLMLPSFDFLPYPRPSRGFGGLFVDLGCRGVLDVSTMAKLDRLCEECYDLFKEPVINRECEWVQCDEC